MAYCTQQHIEDRKGKAKIAELTGDPEGVQVDADKVAAAISDFESRIDAAVRKNYPDLPFDENHKYLNGLNVEGAYLLLERDSERGWTEDFRKEWDMLISELKEIASGGMDLRTETDEQAEEMTEGFFKSGSRLFGRNSLWPEV